MLFNSFIFTVFLPLVFIGYWLLPQRFRNYFLLLASYYFYFTYNPWFLLLLIGTSAFDFWCAKQIQHIPERKKLYLYLSIISNIGVLAAFKYSAFLFNTGVEIANTLGGNHYSLMENLVIPAGLSFYTLQSLSYTIDVFRGKYKPNDTLYEFLLFVSFFPHMVAGPVVRYNTLMPQLKAISYLRQIDWSSFATLTIWGYFKKMVIADNINDIVTPVFNHVTSFSGFELLLSGFLFVIQVYCDFSGYSDIATGVAKLFNVNLSLNWRRPLLSRSLHEFWKRNHISITTWFRDYLYIGLGGNRVSYHRWLFNIFLVFLISGLWHGANFTFIIWGAMHGLMYIIEILLRKRFPAVKIPGFIGWIYLITFHTISLIAFRAANSADLSYIYRHIFSAELFEFAIYSFNDLFQQFMIFLLIAFLFLKELNEEYAFVNRYPVLYANLKPILYVALVVILFMIGDFKRKYIYLFSVLIKKALTYIVIVTLALYGLRYLHWKGLLMQKQGYYAKYRTAFLEKNNFDVLFLGSSRVAMHYNTLLFDSLTGCNSFNLSLSGATPRVSYAALKAYLENSSVPKYIFFETDLHNLHVNSGIMEFNNYFPFLKNGTLLEEFNKIDPRMKQFYYNPYYSWPYTGYRNVSTSVRSWFNVSGSKYDKEYKGFFVNDFQCPLYFVSTKPYKGGFSAMNGKYFEEIIALCKSKGIKLVLVSSPIFGGGKIDLLNKGQIIRVLDQYAAINGIAHLDLSSTPYCNQRELFIDHFHMNYKGACIFTAKLADFYSNNCKKNALNP